MRSVAKFAIATPLILALMLIGIEGETVGLSGEANSTLTYTDAPGYGSYSTVTIDGFEVQVFGESSTEISNDGFVVLPATNLSDPRIQLAQKQLNSLRQRSAEQESLNRILQRIVENQERQVVLQENEVANLDQQLAVLRHLLISYQNESPRAEGDAKGTLDQIRLVNEQHISETAKLGLINALSFALVTSLLVMSPGPNLALIAKTVPTSGRAAGFANIAGFVTAFYFHGTLSILGISAILLASPNTFFIVKTIGATYLCWLGFKAFRDAWRGNNTALYVEPASRQRTLRLSFIDGLLTNVLNPKTSMFYLAAFPQFIPSGNGAAASAFSLLFLQTFINVGWFGTMVLLFTRLIKVGRNASFQRWLNGVTGVVFVGFGLKLAAYRE